MNMVHFVPLNLVGIEFAGFQSLFQMDLIKSESFINCLQTDVSLEIQSQPTGLQNLCYIQQHGDSTGNEGRPVHIVSCTNK